VHKHHDTVYRVQTPRGYEIGCYDHDQPRVKFPVGNMPKRDPTGFKLAVIGNSTHHGIGKDFEFDISYSKLTFVRAPTGAGKTYQVAENIKRMRALHQEAVEEGEAEGEFRVLFVSTRVSFSKSISAGLKRDHGLDFALYSSCVGDEINDQPLLMCQVESLLRINRKFNLIVLDEAASILHQMHSGVRQHDVMTECVSRLMSQADHCVIMDAFLSKSCISMYRAMDTSCGEEQLVNNTFLSYKGAPMEIVDRIGSRGENLSQYVYEVVEALKQGKKVFSHVTLKGDVWAARDKILQLWAAHCQEMQIEDTLRDQITILTGENERK